MLLAGNAIVVASGVCVQGFETSSSWRIIRLGCVTNVKVGVPIDDGIGSLGHGTWRWQMYSEANMCTLAQ
jgi:hypothetical protein